MKKYKLACLASHPIQYFAPLFRHLSERPEVDLTVYFLSDFSTAAFYDPGFGTTFKWDVPLLDGYRYQFLPHLGPSTPLSFFRPWTYGINGLLRRGKFDALWLMGWGRLTNLRALVSARALGTKVLVWGDAHAGGPHLYSARKENIKRKVLPILFRYIDGFLASATANRNWYMDYGVPESKLFLTPYVVDNDLFKSQSERARPRREEFRRELGLEPGRPVILYASKFLSRKRPEDLLEAYVQLSPDGKQEPKPYLLFVGDGELRPRLEARTRELGWESIKFLGFKNQSELPALYDLCDVFVLVPEREGLATVIAEVMNAGKPMIVGDTVGLAADLVVDGQNGYIVKPRDPAVLADRLRKITGDPELAAAMGANGLERIARWNFDAAADGIILALKALTGSPFERPGQANVSVSPLS